MPYHTSENNNNTLDEEVDPNRSCLLLHKTDAATRVEFVLSHQVLEVEVEDLKDLQDTLREMHNGDYFINANCIADTSVPVPADASAKHDDALEEELVELDRKAQNLELYGLTMMGIKKEVGNLHRCAAKEFQLGVDVNSPGKPIR